MDYASYDANHVKHLEMVQGVIARLANHSFLIKGWAVTVAGAFLGFAVSGEDWQLAVASVVPTTLFWVLDATFLRAERLFRELFDVLRSERPALAPFFMAATGPDFKTAVVKRGSGDLLRLGNAARRPALSLFYGTLLAVAIVVAALIC